MPLFLVATLPQALRQSEQRKEVMLIIWILHSLYPQPPLHGLCIGIGEAWGNESQEQKKTKKDGYGLLLDTVDGFSPEVVGHCERIAACFLVFAVQRNCSRSKICSWALGKDSREKVEPQSQAKGGEGNSGCGCAWRASQASYRWRVRAGIHWDHGFVCSQPKICPGR